MARPLESRHDGTVSVAQGAQLPRHIAIIMDGNGRWAQRRGLPRHKGHEAGMKAVRETVETCSDLSIEALTLYVFSTENWKRPPAEVRFLMGLLRRYVRSDLKRLHESNVHIRILGDQQQLSPPVLAAIREAANLTRENTGLTLALAFNYGGRHELVRAVQQLASEAAQGSLDPAGITPSHIEARLFTAGLPDPDLIIRTGGEFRLSNFLLWQAAYAEFWWTADYWPDFDRSRLLEALAHYQRRNRRFGGLVEKEK